MARTSIRIPVTKEYNADHIIQVFSNILSRNGYQQKFIKGEQCWSKGDGVILKQQNFGIVFSNTEIILEGWLGDAITGESDLNGFVAMVPKKKMKKLLEEAKYTISSMV